MTWERTIDGGEEHGELVGGAYRPIRRLAPGEAPIPGELAAVGDDTVVLVDVGELAGWAGWAHGRSQHVCGVTDVVRRTRGHDAVLSRCVLRLDAALRAAPPLSGGEAVTLAVSVLRGAGEVRRARGGEGSRGAWWLTAEGRPAFVPALRDAADGEDCGAAAARIVEEAATGVQDRIVRRLLDEACGWLDDPDAAGDAAEALEERLFEACAPRPLGRLLETPGDDEGERLAVAPGRATDRRTRRELRAARGARRRATPGRRGSGSATARLDLREAIDAALAGRVAEGVSDWLAEARRRLRALRDRRGAPFVLGAVAAAAVVVGGLLWPSDETPAAAEPGAQTAAREGGSRADEDAGAPASPAAATGAAPETGEDDDPLEPPSGPEEEAPGGAGGTAPGAEDPVAAAERLLDGLAVCRAAEDDACAAVRAPGSAPLELADGAAASLPADERRIVLLDDFGDLAVLRVESPEGSAAPQSLVIERASSDERWIVRDVHDGASAPGTTEGDG